MDKRVEAVIEQYEKRRQDERGFFSQPGGVQRGRDELLLSVGPDTAKLLNTIVRAEGSRAILELGTSYGYSTVFLAEAASETGGRVISVDVADYKQAYAREMLERAGLEGVVTFKTGDALGILRELPGPFDCVLLDLWKDIYSKCFELFYPKLAPGAVIVADNIVHPIDSRAEMIEYRRIVRAHRHMESVLLAVGSGIEVSRYVPDGGLK